MISPTTVIGLPGCGRLFTPAAVVVVVHGSVGFVPIFAIGLSQVPFSTVNSGCRIPPLGDGFGGAFSCATIVNAANTRTAAAVISPFISSLRFANVSHGRCGLTMELLARTPVRQSVLIRDVAPQQKSELRRLLQRGEIPVLAKLVRGLVVVLAVVFFVRLFAPPGR